jgi:hypothetical protein
MAALFFCAGMFFLTVSVSSAETIILKSGKRIEGKVVGKTQYYIDIDHQGVVETVFLDDITRIEDSLLVVPTPVQWVETGKQPATPPAAPEPALVDISPVDPDYKTIVNICRNFFVHTFDEDASAWLGDATSDFYVASQVHRNEIKPVNPLIASSTVIDVTAVSLQSNDKKAVGTFLVTRLLASGKTALFRLTVNLIKEGAKWKIGGIPQASAVE